MRILLTGSTGFIGSSLFNELEERGHEVWRLLRYDAHRDWDSSRVVWADLKDGDVDTAVAKSEPEIIIHIGALASNHIANTNPIEAMLTNGVGTAKVVEAATRFGEIPIVVASSSEVYGHLTGAAKPDSEVVAINPYAASKLAAEQAVRASNVPWVLMRPFNTYGRALVNMPKFVVDEAIYSAVVGGRVQLRDPNPLRDFIFRDDHVNAYLKVVEAIEAGKDIYGNTFTFGTGDVMSIGQLANTIATLTETPEPIFTGEKRPMDVAYLHADSTLAQDLLGWRSIGFDEGIKRAVSEWQERYKR